MNMREQEIMTEGFECVDPEVGEQYLHGYVAETLSEDQRQDFEDHLVFCHKCQEDLEYLRWAVQQVKVRGRRPRRGRPARRGLRHARRACSRAGVRS